MDENQMLLIQNISVGTRPEVSDSQVPAEVIFHAGRRGDQIRQEHDAGQKCQDCLSFFDEDAQAWMWDRFHANTANTLRCTLHHC